MKKPIIVFLIFSFFVLLTAFSFAQKDISISSEEIEEMASMYNFEKQTQESIEQSNLLIKDGKLAQAKEELSSTLNLVTQKILAYESKAKNFISENREDIAKTYNRRASALSDMQGRITQSLQKIAAFEEEAAVKNAQKESDYYTTQGFKYLKSGDYANAKTSFEKAISIVPDSRKAKDGLARTEKERVIAQRVSELLRQARDNINIEAFDEAQKQLREVLRLDPGNSKANDYLAEIEKEEPLEAEAKTEIVKEEHLEAEAKTGIKKEKRVKAEEIAKEKLLETEAKEMALMQDFEKQTKESIEQSNLLIREGKLAQAKKELSSTLNLVTQKILLYENKAKNFILESREDIAKIYYKEASALSSMEGRIDQSLEKIAVLEKEAAIKKAKKEAIDIAPDNRKAKDGLARAEKERVRSVAQRVSELLRQARNNINTKAFDEAQKQLQEVLKLDPGNSKANDYLAEIKKGERVKAEEIAKEKRLEAEAKEMALMQDFEKQTQESIEQSNLLIKDGKLVQAKKELSSTLNLVKQKILLYENKAKSLISEKRENVAKVYSRRASTLGNMEGRIGQLLEKITVLEKEAAIKKAEEQSDYYTTQGFEYLKSGDYANAKTSFEKAIDIAPDNRKAEEGLARAEKERVRFVAQRVSELLRQARNNINTKAFDEAQKQLQEVLRLDPGNSKAKDYLAEIKKEERVEAEEIAKDKHLEAEAKEMALMQDFEKQTQESIEQSNLLIQDGKLAQAKKELSSTLNLVTQKILAYENKAKSLISEKRENVAKVYSRRVSTLSNMEGRIGQLLEKIAVLEVDKAGITIYNRKLKQKADEFIGNSLMVKDRELKYKQLEESIRKSIERSKVLLEKTE